MVAINFDKQFAGAVERGEKLQTVRRPRNRQPIVTGTVLQLYTGQRTKSVRKLHDAVCIGTDAVEIDRDSLFVAGRYLDSDDREAFARADGFKDYARMVAWFSNKSSLPFEGRVIQWRLAEPGERFTSS